MEQDKPGKRKTQKIERKPLRFCSHFKRLAEKNLLLEVSSGV
jgi:hypothetical protein